MKNKIKQYQPRMREQYKDNAFEVTKNTEERSAFHKKQMQHQEVESHERDERHHEAE